MEFKKRKHSIEDKKCPYLLTLSCYRAVHQVLSSVDDFPLLFCLLMLNLYAFFSHLKKNHVLIVPTTLLSPRQRSCEGI